MDTRISIIPLHPIFRAAIQRGDIEQVVSHLQDGKDVNSVDPKGRTPLMFAALSGNLELCNLFLEYGADISILNDEGYSAIDIARTRDYPLLVDLLLTSGLSKSPALEVVESQVASASEYFEIWEPEDDVSRPEENDGAIRAELLAVQTSISKHRIRDTDGWLDGIEINLPTPEGLGYPVKLQPDYIQSQLTNLIGFAGKFGFYRLSQLESTVRDIGSGLIEETLQHLQQLMGDLGFVQNDDDNWLSWPLIDSTLVPDVESDDYWQYLQDLAARTNDPYLYLAHDVERSVLLGRGGEERIGLLISLAIKDAVRAIALDPQAMAVLLDLDSMISADPYLAGKISRIDVDGEDEDGNTFTSSRLSSILADVIHIWTRAESVSQQVIISALEKLELTMHGIKMVYGLLLKGGGQNLNLADAVARGTRLECDMFMANLRLAISVAEKYKWSSLPKMDRIQETYLGLLRAIEKFDFDKGYKFSTYATWWLRQSISRAVADKGRLMRVPVHMMEKLNKLARVARMSGFDSLTQIPMMELSRTTDFSEEEIRKVLSIANDIELWEDSPLLHEEVMNVFDDQQDPVVYAEYKELEQIIHAGINELPERQAEIIRYRFGIVDGVEKTLEEVGQIYGLTRERIRQIEAKAIIKLRHTERCVTLLKEHLGKKTDA
ncbi:sigma-70 family RNA polymerase sigma factor [Dickeya zeae]|uniref:sigma-70 family RNA polymerase sigma factor n=1 Tax=Dickeya zeae TaxID=204042 RepID=UPI0003A2A6B8|nr:sigma-70 family RNA polymerase sigma factor [Dickeya zeae]